MKVPKGASSDSNGVVADSDGFFPVHRADYVAFPLGGMGAGMVCLSGTGKLTHVSIRHRPEVSYEPLIFAALHVKGVENGARVLQGPDPRWKASFPYPGIQDASSGGIQTNLGLPKFSESRFSWRFPFARVQLADPSLPVACLLTAWSPFIPSNPDDSSLPAAALEYTLHNTSDKPMKVVFSYHARNFLSHKRQGTVGQVEDGFLLRQPEIISGEWTPEANLAVFSPGVEPAVDCRWFRGGFNDPLAIVWRQISEGTVSSNPPYTEGPAGSGGSLFMEKTIPAGAEYTIPVLLAWYVPNSGLNVSTECGGGAAPKCDCGPGTERECHVPWYASRFEGIDNLVRYWRTHYPRLRAHSAAFSDAFYDTSLTPELVEAAAADLAILKSPTVLRQADGALWGWEGCNRDEGCCSGSCTHVWNYAQALPHLFPSLERTLRETEFLVAQNEEGHQDFRTSLPIRPGPNDQPPAADGQLGGIIKLYRDHRICGDHEWLAGLWPAARQSLEYCVATWDPEETGVLWEPQHNTYDIEFWGPNGMCGSIYLAALKAAELLASEMGEDGARYGRLYEKGRRYVETELWNGEYFTQKVTWKGLRNSPHQFSASLLDSGYGTPEAQALLESEGPRYQYGTGCLSDGVIGAWMAECAGLPEILDPVKVRSHLSAVFRHNFRPDLTFHANTQRPAYAFGAEAGLLLCSWPDGSKPTLPFVYSDEVWTGIEYQVASHLLAMGETEAAAAIVRAARSRYDGSVRNPFDECECGHWYARAMASYALMTLGSGVRYDAVSQTLIIRRRDDADFRAFLAVDGGFGTVGVSDGKPFVQVRHGEIPVDEIDLQIGGG